MEREESGDIRVYGSTELYDRPFRDVGSDPWSRNTWQSLKDEIATHDLTEGAGIEYINVLLVGEVGMVKDRDRWAPLKNQDTLSTTFGKAERELSFYQLLSIAHVYFFKSSTLQF